MLPLGFTNLGHDNAVVENRGNKHTVEGKILLS